MFSDDYLACLLRGADHKNPILLGKEICLETNGQLNEMNEGAQLGKTKQGCEMSEKLAKYLNFGSDLNDASPQGEGKSQFEEFWRAGQCPELFQFEGLEPPAYAAGAFHEKPVKINEDNFEFGGKNFGSENDVWRSPAGEASEAKNNESQTLEAKRSALYLAPAKRPTHQPRPWIITAEVDIETTDPDLEPRFLREISIQMLRQASGDFSNSEALRSLAAAIYIVARRFCPYCRLGGNLPPKFKKQQRVQEEMQTLCWSTLHYRTGSLSTQETRCQSDNNKQAYSLTYLDATLILLLFIYRLQRMESQRRLMIGLAGSPSGCKTVSQVWKQNRPVNLPTAMCLLTAAICFLRTVQKTDHASDSRHSSHATVGSCCTCPGYALLPCSTQPHVLDVVRTPLFTGGTSRSRMVHNAKKLLAANSSASIGRHPPQSTPLTMSTSSIPCIHNSRAITYPLPACHQHNLIEPNNPLAMSTPIDPAHLEPDGPSRCPDDAPHRRTHKQNILTRILYDVKTTRALLLPLASKLHTDSSYESTKDTMPTTLPPEDDADQQTHEVLIRDCAAIVELIRRFCSAVFVASAWVDEVEPISSAVIGDFLSSAFTVLSSNQRCRRLPRRSVPFNISCLPGTRASPSDTFGLVRSRAIQLKRLAAVTASTISGACMNSGAVELIESPPCLICRENHTGRPFIGQTRRHQDKSSDLVKSQTKKSLGLTSFDFERLTLKLFAFVQYNLRVDPIDFWTIAPLFLRLIKRFERADVWSPSPFHGCLLKPVLSDSSVLTSTSCNSVSTTEPASLRTHSMPFSSSMDSSWIIEDSS